MVSNTYSLGLAYDLTSSSSETMILLSITTTHTFESQFSYTKSTSQLLSSEVSIHRTKLNAKRVDDSILQFTNFNKVYYNLTTVIIK